jgi:branched-chain amino acid transport system substrate-binding protein
MSGCGGGGTPTSNPKTEYAVGQLAALTGPSAPADYGVALRNASELAIDEINSNGIVKGGVLKLTVEDHQSSGAVAVTAMQKLVGINGMQLVLSSDTAVNTAIAPIATQNKVLVLNCCARSSRLATVSPYVYTTRPFDVVEEQTLMRYLKDKKGFTKVAMIHNATASGASSEALLKSFLPTVGMRLVDVEVYPSGTSDYSSYLAKIKNSGADVMYMNTFGVDIGSILIQAKQFGLTLPIASFSSALDPTVVKAASTAAEGMFISSQVNWDPAHNPDQKKFVERYKTRYGAEPAGFAATEYDTVRFIVPLLVNYIVEHKLSYTGQNLKTALDSIKTFKGGLTGTCTITADHQCVKDMAIYTVTNGQFVQLLVAPAAT